MAHSRYSRLEKNKMINSTSSFVVGLLYLVTVCGSILASPRHGSNTHEWSLFKARHGKSYASPSEEARRFANFMRSKTRVERHNAAAAKSYSMALNYMSDWSDEELAKLTRLRSEAPSAANELSIEQEAYLNAIIGDESAPVPDEVDWRKVPERVSPVQNQGDCGSCWSFATTGVLEGQQVPRNISKKLIKLSEQELIDCHIRDNDCQGGYVWDALDDVAELGGIVDSNKYPYTAAFNETCTLNKSESIMTVKGSIKILDRDADKLKRLVANFGPVAAGMFCSTNFFSYKEGVFTDSICWKDNQNHAILIVGYGTDPKGGDYWLVKNSWAEDWGDKGYFKIKRGENMCAIEFRTILPKF